MEIDSTMGLGVSLSMVTHLRWAVMMVIHSLLTQVYPPTPCYCLPWAILLSSLDVPLWGLSPKYAHQICPFNIEMLLESIYILQPSLKCLR